MTDTTSAVTFKALGISISLDVANADLRNAILAIYGAFPTQHDAPLRHLQGGLNSTSAGTTAWLGDNSTTVTDPWLAIRALNHLIVDAVVLERRDLLHFHAAVIEYRGVGFVFMGEAGAGKSSLSLAFCELGATFLSDELLAFDVATQTALAFPRAPKLREISQPSFPQALSVSVGMGDSTFVPLHSLERTTVGMVTSPKIIVFPRYQAIPGAIVEGMTAGQSSVEASLHALNFGSHGPDNALSGLAALTMPCRSFKVGWSNPKAARDAILWSISP